MKDQLASSPMGMLSLLLLFSVTATGLSSCAHSPEAVDDVVVVETEPEMEDVPATPPIPSTVDLVEGIEPSEEAGTMLEPAAVEPAEPTPPVVRADPAAMAAFEAGVQAAERGDFESSRMRFAEAVRIEPELEWGWYNLGIVYERAGKVREALEAWEKALEVDGSFTPAAINVARTLVRQGRAREAERMLRERIRKYPENLDLRNELARVMVAQETPAKLDAAFAEARQVLSTDERNVGAFLVLAEVFVKQGKYELAEWVVDRVLALEPENPGAHQIKGFLHLRQDERREAFASFQRAARFGGEYAEMYVNYGAFLNQAQDFDSALEQLEVAVEYAPRMVEARLNLGNAYRGAGRYQEALAEYNRVRDLDPGNVDALLNKALVYLDAPLEEVETLARLTRAKELLAAYSSEGGEDDRLPDFMRDVERAIDSEQRRLERETLRQAREEEEARREAEEEAARLAEEEAARRAEEEAEAERARREAEEAFRQRLSAEEEATRLAEEEADEERRVEDEEDEDEDEDDEEDPGSRLDQEEDSREGTILGGEDP